MANGGFSLSIGGEGFIGNFPGKSSLVNEATAATSCAPSGVFLRQLLHW
jgi:hypothetical protein